MNLTQEDFQRAKRISRAIQDYLSETNQNGLRSTDLYPILARKGLVEKDERNGKEFRTFLRKLKNAGVLKQLIPQCEYRTTRNHFLEWHFYQQYSNK